VLAPLLAGKSTGPNLFNAKPPEEVGATSIVAGRGTAQESRPTLPSFCDVGRMPQPIRASHQLIVVIAGQESGRHSIVEDCCNQVTNGSRARRQSPDWQGRV
jgi:hypothetical protein